MHREAARLCRTLKDAGVVTDYRPPDIVRFAPVPSSIIRLGMCHAAVERLVEIPLASRAYENYPVERALVAMSLPYLGMRRNCHENPRHHPPTTRRTSRRGRATRAFDYRLTWRMDAGASVNVGAVTMGTHNGTHADAPCHFLPDGARIDALDPTIYVGPAMLVDVSHARAGPSAARRWRICAPGVASRRAATVAPDRRVAGRCAFSRAHPDARARRTPAWLGALGVRLLGLDIPSVDTIESQDLPIHHALAAAGDPHPRIAGLCPASCRWVSTNSSRCRCGSRVETPLRCVPCCGAEPLRSKCEFPFRLQTASSKSVYPFITEHDLGRAQTSKPTVLSGEERQRLSAHSSSIRMSVLMTQHGQSVRRKVLRSRCNGAIRITDFQDCVYPWSSGARCTWSRCFPIAFDLSRIPITAHDPGYRFLLTARSVPSSSDVASERASAVR